MTENAPSDEERALAINEGMCDLTAFVGCLAEAIGRPEWVPDGDSGCYRYRSEDPSTLQVLKAVRVVSTLNACTLLLAGGYYMEIITLLRTANDFLSEIAYVHEALQSGKPTAGQQRFVDHYFAPTPTTPEGMIADPPRGSGVTRNEIQASFARQLNPDDSHRIIRMQRAVDATFSGYIHGTYGSTMELYEGGTWQFRTTGMANTPRVGQAIKQMALTIDRAFSTFRGVAWALRMEDIFQATRVRRLAFEASAACHGMTLTISNGERSQETSG